MLNYRIKILFIAIGYWLFAVNYVSALTDQEKIAQLRQQIQQLEEQAKQYKGTIAQQQQQVKTLKNEIISLKTQVSNLENQIALTGKKIKKTNIEINNVRDDIYDTQEKINYQKNSIGRILLFLNQRDKENLVAILLKNNDLSDFFRQTDYAASVNKGLLGLISEYKETKNKYEHQKKYLEDKKNELEGLKHQQSSQKLALNQVTQDKNQLLTQTKGQEAQYQKLLAQVEQQENQFFIQLRELETRVIQGGLYIVHVTAGSLPKKGTKLFQWPEDDYHITQGYGCTKYARCGSRRGAYGGAPHNGIDIGAGFGSPIKAIGDGRIIANGRNDGWGNWVAIQHSSTYNLVSVYAHMSVLSFLQVSTSVKAGDIIGYEGNTGNAEGSHLHLSLYKDFFTYINDKKDQLYFNYFEGTVNPLDYL